MVRAKLSRVLVQDGVQSNHAFLILNGCQAFRLTPLLLYFLTLGLVEVLTAFDPIHNVLLLEETELVHGEQLWYFGYVISDVGQPNKLHALRLFLPELLLVC